MKPAPKAKRVAWLAAMGLSGLIVLIALLFVWRGTHATTSPKTPTRAEDGTHCQLYRDPSGHTPVRCAAVIDARPEAVWKVVTDYARFGEIFASPFWRVEVSETRAEADGRQRLVGRVVAPYAEYPFDVKIRHETAPDRSVASWDESDGAGNSTRGSWTVTPAEGGRTLLVYQQEVVAKRSPRFIVNNLLLAQLGGAMKRVKLRLASDSKP